MTFGTQEIEVYCDGPTCKERTWTDCPSDLVDLHGWVFEGDKHYCSMACKEAAEKAEKRS